jgi:hypothetical protein
MTPRAPYVSVVDPIGPAIERVKMVLFRPFSFERWIIIGFCAWLAHLAEGGGGGGGGRGNFNASNAEEFRGMIHEGREFVTANLYWLLPVTIIGVIFIIALWLLIVWLNSRGRFMFLYCVAQNKAEVKNPWYQFGEHGDRLFAFRVVLGIIAIVAMLLFTAMIVAPIFVVKNNLALLVVGGVVGGLLLFIGAILFMIIGKLTKDFVVPIMYLRTPSAVAAWRVLLDILAFNKARFVLYILFHIVISLAIGSIVLAIGCLTCGCACCLLALPFIGTVVLLPVLVFLRSYSLFYLAQYGPEFNAFAPVPQVIPPAGPPLVQPPGTSLG